MAQGPELANEHEVQGKKKGLYPHRPLKKVPKWIHCEHDSRFLLDGEERQHLSSKLWKKKGGNFFHLRGKCVGISIGFSILNVNIYQNFQIKQIFIWNVC